MQSFIKYNVNFCLKLRHENGHFVAFILFVKSKIAKTKLSPKIKITSQTEIQSLDRKHCEWILLAVLKMQINFFCYNQNTAYCFCSLNYRSQINSSFLDWIFVKFKLNLHPKREKKLEIIVNTARNALWIKRCLPIWPHEYKLRGVVKTSLHETAVLLLIKHYGESQTRQ